MRLTKNKKWEVTANPNDLVGFLHEMEALLLDSASSIGSFQLKGYFVGAENRENHHYVSAGDLLDVIASLTNPLTALKADYFFRDPDQAASISYTLSLWVFANKRPHREARVDVTLGGPMTDEANKAFEAILARLTREIGRKNRAVPLPPAPVQAIDSKSVPSASPVAENFSKPPTFIRTLTTQPLPVALFSSVFGAVIGGGVVLLIGMLISDHRSDDRPTPPSPPSSSQAPATTLSPPRLPTDEPVPTRPPAGESVPPR